MTTWIFVFLIFALWVIIFLLNKMIDRLDKLYDLLAKVHEEALFDPEDEDSLVT